MKKHVLTLLAAGFFAHTTFAQENEIIRCGSNEYQLTEESNNPLIIQARELIEQQTREFVESQKTNPSPTAVIVIPIVFHIVWNAPGDNVTDACINAQLLSTNNDFRKLNADWTSTPSVWQSLVADLEVQFCLAVRDPLGNPTTGITRTQTTDPSFSTDNQVKYNAQGGKDIWNRNNYLNVWVCDLSGGLLGYAQFPGGAAATDGVVQDYAYMMASAGCGLTPYHLGRTLSHEIGHWVNLRHINGDANCGSDLVTDTPTQDALHGGCPTHPYHVNVCSGSSNGEMFMNYMDYTNDACMYMFTAGQKTRILATLNGTRVSLQTSNGCQPLTGVGNDLSASENLVMVFPNPSSGIVNMEIHLDDMINLEVNVMNSAGQLIAKTKGPDIQGYCTSFDLRDQPNGLYLIEVKNATSSTTRKLLLNK